MWPLICHILMLPGSRAVTYKLPTMDLLRVFESICMHESGAWYFSPGRFSLWQFKQTHRSPDSRKRFFCTHMHYNAQYHTHTHTFTLSQTLSVISSTDIKQISSSGKCVPYYGCVCRQTGRDDRWQETGETRTTAMACVTAGELQVGVTCQSTSVKLAPSSLA